MEHDADTQKEHDHEQDVEGERDRSEHSPLTNGRPQPTGDRLTADDERSSLQRVLRAIRNAKAGLDPRQVERLAAEIEADDTNNEADSNKKGEHDGEDR